MIPTRDKMSSQKLTGEDMPIGQHNHRCLYVLVVCFIIFSVASTGTVVYMLITISKLQDDLIHQQNMIDDLIKSVDLWPSADSYNDDYDTDYGDIEYESKENLTYDLGAFDLTKDMKHNYRRKRNVPTNNGELQINSESYRKIKQHGKNPLKLYELLSSTPSNQQETTHPAKTARDNKQTTRFQHYERMSTRPMTESPSPIFTRKSRVMHSDVKRPVLKSLDQKSYQDQLSSTEMSTHKGHRNKHRHRQRLVETLDEPQFAIIRPNRKHMIAVHFSGDSSKYVQGQDMNFNGNGHMRHLDKTYVDWRARDWVGALNMDQYFNMEKGELTIKETGLYFVYAQIYYLDKHDLNGYIINKNGHAILQCTTMTHSQEPVMKSNTCYTAGVEHFSDGDKLSIHDLSDGRYSVFEKEKSFFGAVKLSDGKMK